MKLYGTSRSRASRCLVLLEELGAAYEHVPLFADGRDVDADRALMNRLNPNGHIPILDDGGSIIWESMAINLHLAETLGRARGLWPDDPWERAMAYQWSLWGQTEIDRADWNRARRSGDGSQIATDREALVAALRRLDAALAGRIWLLGERFTVADVNLSTTLSEPHERCRIGWQKLDPAAEGLNQVANWLARCAERPAHQRVLAMP